MGFLTQEIVIMLLLITAWFFSWYATFYNFGKASVSVVLAIVCFISGMFLTVCLLNEWKREYGKFEGTYRVVEQTRVEKGLTI